MRFSGIAFVFGILVLAAAGCPGSTGGPGVIDPPPVSRQCQANSECGVGFVCAGGECEVGECDPALNDICGGGGELDPDEVEPFCCKAWQLCNSFRQCAPNPDAPVGAECEVNEDCVDVGQFCSGGTCYDPGGRSTCTSDFQCAGDERCDPNVYLCVPDLGGCAFCNDFPELCCEDEQVCDVESGYCLDIDEEPECTQETVQQDCLPGRVCDDLGRCVQCLSDDDCGPGTACNTGTGFCYSTSNTCSSDDDCEAPRRCSPVSDECVIPECEVDSQCDGAEKCDATSFTCYLPPATCDEDDEPNNSTGEAASFDAASNYTATLCRGDTDYVGFGITSDRRYRVTVSFPDYNVGGTEVALLNSNGVIQDTRTISTFQTEATVTGISGEDETGSFYVRISGGSADADIWAYTISVEETEAPDIVTCAEEMTLGIEPNNDFTNAYTLAPGVYSFSRCDFTDVDYYRIDLPAQSGVSITIEHDTSLGDLTTKLYDTPGGSTVDTSDSSSGIDNLEGPEGPSAYYLRVGLWDFASSGTDGQPYTVTVNAVPRPSECDDDLEEPANDELDTAPTINVDTTVEALHCVPVDIDYYAFTLPANAGGTANLNFTHSQGDLRLDILDTDGNTVVSSNTSSSGNSFERLELPFSAEDQDFIALVRLNSGGSNVGQAYTFQIDTYDASTCVASEPTPNNVFLDGYCVGTPITDFACSGPTITSGQAAPALTTCNSTPSTAGCGTVCGATDEDWYRAGILNNGQLLRARVVYDPGAPEDNIGRLGLAIARGNVDFSSVSVIESIIDTDGTGDLEVAFNAPSTAPQYEREYAVRVMPEGDGSYGALPYTIELEVGEPCLEDAFEPNANPSEAAFIRATGQPNVAYTEDFDASICGFDVDVYEMFAFVGESVTATLIGPPGVTVDIGTRPADITDDADVIASSSAIGSCPISLAGASNCQQATFSNDQIRQLYFTVKRTDTNSYESIGSYKLRISVN